MLRGIILFIVLVKFAISKDDDGKLISVAVVFRHGDRTPTTTYPNDPYKDILIQFGEPGELTDAGKHHQYVLGGYLRTRYDGFLPQKYSKDDIYVVADDMDRCLMSAEANLAALYKPNASQIWEEGILWQPIPVHIDFKMLWGEPYECDRYEHLKLEVYQSDFVKRIDEENRELYKYLSEHSGSSVAGLDDANAIRKTLYIETELNLVAPNWTKSVFPDKLDNLSAITLGIQTNNTEMTKFSAGPLLNAIFEEFNNKSHKMILFSAHDTNVAQVVQAVNPKLEKFNPEFSSAVLMELREAAGEEVIRVYLKRYDKVTTVYSGSFADLKSQLKDIAVDNERWVQDCASSGYV